MAQTAGGGTENGAADAAGMADLAGVALRPAAADTVARLQAQGLEPLAARVFAARGVSSLEETAPQMKTLPPPDSLHGIDDMARCLQQAIESGEMIGVVGDYDVDGVTATALAVECLQTLGAQVKWYLPNRHTDGYGLSPVLADRVAAEGARHLLTVDNGITAHAGIARARQSGMRVYVTDHHRPDGQTVQADAVINPHLQKTCAVKNLVGVGVAFYLMARLRALMNKPLDMLAHTDLVALGTIADCAEMDAVNRALTGAGLARIRAGRTRPGILALLRLVGMRPDALTCRAAGFKLAPRINAAGRIDSADIALHCLSAKTDQDAEAAAAALDGYNRRRLALQDEMMNSALKKCDPARAGETVYDENWHAGLVGIVAGKLAERGKRPVFAFYCDIDGQWRGSGRAAGAVDLVGILSELARARPDVALSYGGHSQAASIKVARDKIDDFSALFSAACAAAQGSAPRDDETLVDALSAADLNETALRQMEKTVWGNGFPSPRYAGCFEQLRAEAVRGGHVRLQLRDKASGAAFGAIFFGASCVPSGDLKILYGAELDTYANKPQLIIERLL